MLFTLFTLFTLSPSLFLVYFGFFGDFRFNVPIKFVLKSVIEEPQSGRARLASVRPFLYSGSSFYSKFRLLRLLFSLKPKEVGKMRFLSIWIDQK